MLPPADPWRLCPLPDADISRLACPLPLPPLVPPSSLPLPPPCEPLTPSSAGSEGARAIPVRAFAASTNEEKVGSEDDSGCF